MKVVLMEQDNKLRIHDVIVWYVFHGPHFKPERGENFKIIL